MQWDIVLLYHMLQVASIAPYFVFSSRFKCGWLESAVDSTNEEKNLWLSQMQTVPDQNGGGEERDC